MKTLIGLVLVIVGVAVGLYVGIYLCFFRGIVTVIEQIRADVMVVSVLVWGTVRILGAGFFGWLSAFVFVIPGMAILSDWGEKLVGWRIFPPCFFYGTIS